MKLLRRIVKVYDKCRSRLTIYYLNKVYEGCTISKDSYIGKHCSIQCTDGSRLVIDRTFVSDGTAIVADHGGQVLIDHAFIGRGCVIVARQRVEIKSDSQIAEMTVIRDQNHNFGDPTRPIAQQGFTVEPVSVGPNAWLGAKVTVTAGCRVGEGAVVGANAVVTKDVPDRTIAVGIPARAIEGSKHAVGNHPPLTTAA